MNASTPAVSASFESASPRVFNPWLIALAVVVPTFMEVLDTTIANVALRYIAGGLSAAVTDSEWVITSYLAANAIILPISGWLSAHLGRRNYFLLSIAVFTISSGLCGMATSLGQLIFFRVMQGFAGGGLQPSSQAILLDSFRSRSRAPPRLSLALPHCWRPWSDPPWEVTSPMSIPGGGSSISIYQWAHSRCFSAGSWCRTPNTSASIGRN